MSGNIWGFKFVFLFTKIASGRYHGHLISPFCFVHRLNNLLYPPYSLIVSKEGKANLMSYSTVGCPQ